MTNRTIDEEIGLIRCERCEANGLKELCQEDSKPAGECIDDVPQIKSLIGKRLLGELKKKQKLGCFDNTDTWFDCIELDDIRKVFKDVLNIEGE